MMPLRLTQAQLETLTRLAQPIPYELRGEYLKLIAEAVSGDVGDGEFHWICASAQKHVLWHTVRDEAS
jgi:hypothetical protein